MPKIRTRFAPSPTGPLHIGGVRTALYAFLFAKKNHGDFILRIEDTDTARTVENTEEIINKSLEWCGIIPDEGVKQGGNFGPYKQSERKEIYSKYAQKLIENGSAYYAFDTEEEIKEWRESTAKDNKGNSLPYNYNTRESMRNSISLSEEKVKILLESNTPYVVRLKVKPEDHIEFTDIVRDTVKFHSAQLDDRVLLKSDGMPTYHLANVVDDHLMEITHVIRGEEWLASTPHHILLYKAFGWEDSIPSFAHLPLFLKPDGKGKLSKRDGDRLGFPVFCIEWTDPSSGNYSKGYKEIGFLSESFVNFIAMLGWNDGTERELFDMASLIENFSLERVQKAGAKFNYEKAKWFNQQYIREMDNSLLVNLFKSQVPKTSLNSIEIEQYCELFKERIEFTDQLSQIGKFLYTDEIEYDTKMWNKKWKDSFIPFFEGLNQKYDSVEWKESSIFELVKSEMDSQGFKMGEIMPIMRIALMGTMKGPSVFAAMEFLGKEKAIERLSNFEKIQ